MRGIGDVGEGIVKEDGVEDVGAESKGELIEMRRSSCRPGRAVDTPS